MQPATFHPVPPIQTSHPDHPVKESDKPDKTKDEKKGWNIGGLGPLALTFPAMTAVGAAFMLPAILLGVGQVRNEAGKEIIKHSMEGWRGNLFKQAKQHLPGLTGDKLVKAYNFGKGFVIAGLVPKSMVVVQYGLNTGQPTTVLSGLLQMVAGPVAGFLNLPFATLVNYFCGLMQTIGFANDVENTKLRARGDKMKNFYNMDPLLKALNPLNGEPMAQRMKVLKRDFVHRDDGKPTIPVWIFKDHKQAIKNGVHYAVGGVKHLAHLAVNPQQAKAEFNHAMAVLQQKDPNGETAGSPNMSRVFVTMGYAGAIPQFLSLLPGVPTGVKLAMENAKSKMMLPAMLIGDTSFILIALGGKTLLDKAPAVGQSTEMMGSWLGNTANSKPYYMLAQALGFPVQQIGASVNMLYFGSREKKGEDTDSAPPPPHSMPATQQLSPAFSG